ncbi:MAG TPA: glycerate kinase [Gaiellaceae bacterium]|nr:glycerate kinase [Gaiellaceae bacterium]
MRALACPASLKGVVEAVDAAHHLAAGLRRGGADAVELPVADGGEGTADVLQRVLGGHWRSARVSDPLGRPVDARWLELPDGTAVVESAAAAGLPLLAPEERDPLRASSRGVGELLAAALAERPAAVLVGVGGVATVDGGDGLAETIGPWPAGVPLQVLCDVRNPLLGPRGAARVFGPQKGADPEAVEELERRLAARPDLAPYRDLPGAGAAGGLGAALASLGGRLVRGAETILDRIGFDELARGADLVVTGEGTADATTLEGKAPGAVRDRCARLGVRCVLFGGLVRDGVDALPLSGDPHRAVEDLEALGRRLAGGD